MTTEGAPQDEVVVLEQGATWPLVLGLLLLGTVLGGVTAASGAEGISTTLLSSLLTFVAGAVLTFSGFRFQRRRSDPVRISPARVGAALIGLCLGIWIGLGVGVYAKIRWMTWNEDHDLQRETARKKAERPVATPTVATASTPSTLVAPTALVASPVAPVLIQLPCAAPSSQGSDPKKPTSLLQTDP